jgi:hypothetical protein
VRAVLTQGVSWSSAEASDPVAPPLNLVLYMHLRIFAYTSNVLHGEEEGGADSHSKRKQDGSLTTTCQVGGHVSYRNIIPIPNGGTEGVAHHFLKYHTDLNVRIRVLKVLPGAAKNPPDFMKESNWNDTHTLTHPDIHRTPTSI